MDKIQVGFDISGNEVHRIGKIDTKVCRISIKVSIKFVGVGESLLSGIAKSIDSSTATNL